VSADIAKLVEHGLTMMLEGLKKIEHRDEWVDQARSPLGRTGHLDAVKRGLVKGSKVGRKVLVRRADLDAYIEKHRVHRATFEEEQEEQKEVQALLDEPAPMRRRRKSA
jgi:hypothetical protein